TRPTGTTTPRSSMTRSGARSGVTTPSACSSWTKSRVAARRSGLAELGAAHQPHAIGLVPPGQRQAGEPGMQAERQDPLEGILHQVVALAQAQIEQHTQHTDAQQQDEQRQQPALPGLQEGIAVPLRALTEQASEQQLSQKGEGEGQDDAAAAQGLVGHSLLAEREGIENQKEGGEAAEPGHGAQTARVLGGSVGALSPGGGGEPQCPGAQGPGNHAQLEPE